MNLAARFGQCLTESPNGTDRGSIGAGFRCPVSVKRISEFTCDATATGD